MRHKSADLPFIGVRAHLPLSAASSRLHGNQTRHTIWFKYHSGNFKVAHGFATEEQKAECLSLTNEDAKVRDIVSKSRLDVITLPLHKGRGAEVTGIGTEIGFVDDATAAILDRLAELKSASKITICCWAYPTIEQNMKWMLACMKSFKDPLLHYYMPSKKRVEPQAKVQSGSLREFNPDMSHPFEPRTTCHSYNDRVILSGYGEAYEGQQVFELARSLRGMRVRMAVFNPEPEQTAYCFAFLTIPNWDKLSVLFQEGDRLLITWSAPPENVSNQELSEQGRKKPKDTAQGWNATVLPESIVDESGVLMCQLHRPADGKPLGNIEMPTGSQWDDPMPTQKVYIKVRPSALTRKARLQALDRTRLENAASEEVGEKRCILVGRDLEVKKTVDLLSHLTPEQIEYFAANLTPSQRDFFTDHCRRIQHGINLLQEPFGTGKSKTAALLAIVEALKPNGSTWIATTSNAASDALTTYFDTNNDLLVVRAHAMSLKTRDMSKPYFHQQAIEKAVPLHNANNAELDAPASVVERGSTATLASSN